MQNLNSIVVSKRFLSSEAILLLPSQGICRHNNEQIDLPKGFT
jgi:hypothetical protein